MRRLDLGLIGHHLLLSAHVVDPVAHATQEPRVGEIVVGLGGLEGSLVDVDHALCEMTVGRLVRR